MRWSFWAFLLVESFLICASLTIKPIPDSSIKCSQACVCPPCSFSTQVINAILIMMLAGMIRLGEGKYFVLSSIYIVWTTAVRVMGDLAVYLSNERQENTMQTHTHTSHNLLLHITFWQDSDLNLTENREKLLLFGNWQNVTVDWHGDLRICSPHTYSLQSVAMETPSPTYLLSISPITQLFPLVAIW